MEQKEDKLRYINHQEDPQSIGQQEFDRVVKKMMLQSMEFYVIDQQLFIELIDQEKKNPHDSKQVQQSTGKSFEDPYIYLGVSGTTYMYYRLFAYAKRSNQEDMADIYLMKALESQQIAKTYLANKATKGGISKSDMSPSFYFGMPGVYTLSAVLEAESKGPDSQEVQEAVEEVLQYQRLFKDFADDLEDELLYGSAGYLYCLLLLKRKLGPKYNEKLDPVIALVTDTLLQAGLDDDVDFLYYSFPRGNKGKAYLGAAHGTIGIIYMLIKAIQSVQLLSYNSTLIKKIKLTLKMLTDQQSVTGNLPYILNEPVNIDREPTHWCHGAPGAIPLFIEAYNLFKDKQYLSSALKCGECVWERGLLKKGFGLCHGVSGNAYMLMALYKHTGDSIWKFRAEQFMIWTTDPEKVDIVKKNQKSGFKVIGTPDTPYSLMEGQAQDFFDKQYIQYSGQITAYADFFGWKDTKHTDLDILFPGYEV